PRRRREWPRMDADTRGDFVLGRCRWENNMMRDCSTETETGYEGHMAELWNSDEELFALARRELFTAVVGDVMDKVGLMRQFLDPRLQPLREDMVVIGRAMTVLEAD